MDLQFYSHSFENQPTEKWHILEEHLNSVAELATGFAEVFHAEKWTELLGKYHDLGKATMPWQAYLRHANGIIDEYVKYYKGHPTHAMIGAQWLYKNSKEAGKLLAYCIAGHHSGLHNWNGSNEFALSSRLGEEFPAVHISSVVPEYPEDYPFTPDANRLGYQVQFFVRMLYSCLVDADYLDTENAFDFQKTNWRSIYPPLDELIEKFWDNFNILRKNADDSLVNRQREIVLEDCVQSAKMNTGLFSLTVPTGGGKTLASLAFALEHAKIHHKRRIIYVIPYTSIIEQNATVFRNMLGDDAVLEHHSNFVPDDSDWKTRLAAENWDASVVVTTNVQFFNSFYSNKPSKCRKLHNVADSIVIFDEVQAIPVEKLKPCLEVIKELSLNYGVSSILCTATQPAIEYSENFQSGLENVCEIIKDVPALFSELKRTEEIYIGELSVQEVSNRLLKHKQVLCIVNSRQQALDVYEALPESDSTIHLSALMYPIHRTRQLNRVRELLENNSPCRVVSTQLIEAGVDIDFPSVYRAVTGIDSIAQAAGRCNRNGSSETPQTVFVFEFPEDISCAFFRMAAQSAAKLFDRFSGKLTSPYCVREYFADFFWMNEQRMDSDGIIEICNLAQEGNIQFRDIAEFRMIKSATIPIIIAMEDSAVKLVKSLKFAVHKGGILRKLQRYTVQIYPYQFEEIEEWLENPEPGIWVLRSEKMYSSETGLKCTPPEGNAFFG